MVNDVLVNILFIGDLVKTIDKLIELNYTGIINISGDKIYSRYELGIEIATLLNKNINLIESVTSSEFKTIAKRPLNTSFDNTLLKKLGINPRPLKQTISYLI